MLDTGTDGLRLYIVCDVWPWSQKYMYHMILAYTYQCLDHLHPLEPHVVDDAHDIHSSFLSCLTECRVQGYEHTSPTHSSTAERQHSLYIQLFKSKHIFDHSQCLNEHVLFSYQWDICRG